MLRCVTWWLCANLSEENTTALLKAEVWWMKIRPGELANTNVCTKVVD
jgi:hypothetical protein